MLVGGELHLPASVGCAHPRALEGRPSAAERHRALLGAPASGGSLRVVATLRSDHLGDLGLHQLVHDTEPDTDRERQQVLLRGAGEVAERCLDGLGQFLPHCFSERCDLRCGYLRVSTRRGSVMAAMQHGLPIIGAYGELTDESLHRSGALELVARGDLKACSHAAAALAQDPARRAALGTVAAALYRREFDWPVIGARLHKRLGSIDSAHSRGEAVSR